MKVLYNSCFNPSSPKGVIPTPQRFSPWCSKSHSQGVKLRRVPSSSSFPFILAKKFRTYHLHRGEGKLSKLGGGGGWCDPVIFELDILKIFEVICTHKFVCKLEWPFSKYFAKNSMKIACFYDFLRKNQFLPIFYTQNGHFSIFVGALTL